MRRVGQEFLKGGNKRLVRRGHSKSNTKRMERSTSSWQGVGEGGGAKFGVWW